MPNFNLAGEDSFASLTKKSDGPDASSLILNDERKSEAMESDARHAPQSQLPSRHDVLSETKKVGERAGSEIDLTPKNPLEHDIGPSPKKAEPEIASTEVNEKEDLRSIIEAVAAEEYPPITHEPIWKHESHQASALPSPAASEMNTDSIDPQADHRTETDKQKIEEIPGPRTTRRKRPFIFFLLSILFLLCAAILLYYLEVYPPLNTFVRNVLGKKETAIYQPEKITVKQESDPSVPLEKFDYDYYLQVSSWDKQYLAGRERERFLKKNIPAVVEGDFISSRRRTYFRVRLGPFHSREEIAKIKARAASMIPRDAFIDSSLATGEKRSTPQIKKDKPAATLTPHSATSLTPTSGYVVAVSSFRQKAEADKETRDLLSNGMSSFVKSFMRKGETWYRVQVGPFQTKDDAKKYLQLIQVTHGNDAYILNLSNE